MKLVAEFVKTTLGGGFFVLLPLLISYILFGELLEAVVGLATPIADLFPAGYFDEVSFPVVIAVMLIVIVSFLLGIAMRQEVFRKLGNWIERNTVGRLALYQAIKSLSSRLAAIDEGERFRPALVVGPNDHRELAYLVEQLGSGRAMVMLPRAPTPMAGSLKVVPMDCVELLDISLSEFTMVISHWGVGSKEIVGKAM